MEIAFLLILILFPIYVNAQCEEGQTSLCPNALGICASGVRECINGAWSSCSILPLEEEICDNNKDDNCNGLTDENCICNEGETEECGTTNIGRCQKGTRTCTNGFWSACTGLIEPEEEKPEKNTCNDKVDNDCDDKTDANDPDCLFANLCNDRIKNYDEEGVDCGGISCSHKPCPTCYDKIRNQGEEQIDCGGPCSHCETCNDGTKNQNEEDIDCGGKCPPCQAVFIEDSVEDFDEEETDEENTSFPFSITIFIIIIFLLIIFLILLNKVLKGKKIKKEKQKSSMRMHSSFLGGTSQNYEKQDKLTKSLRKIK
mgnify:CR=1 FL=1